MDLTWDLVGENLFLAALLLLAFGLGKSMVAITVVEWHLLTEKGRTREYEKEERSGIRDTLYDGVLESIAGIAIIIIIMTISIFTGFIDDEGWSILKTLSIVFGALVVLLSLLARRYQ